MSKKNRKLRKTKRVIYVYCEGETEIKYLQAIQNRYEDAVSIHTKKAMIDSNKILKNDIRFTNNESTIDEVWFFFDIEESDKQKWPSRKRIIEKLLKNKQKYKVRLLLTTGLIEYWFLLHYTNVHPASLSTLDEKERIINQLKNYVPCYKKNDLKSVIDIANSDSDACKNAANIMNQINGSGISEIPSQEKILERMDWIQTHNLVITTVHEAIIYLEELKEMANM